MYILLLTFSLPHPPTPLPHTQSRDQLPVDLLRETRDSERAPQRRRESIDKDDDDSKLGRFLTRAKSAARKGKEGLVAKYKATKNRAGKHEDSVELLPSNSSSEELQRSARVASSVRVERGAGHVSRSNAPPPRDLFNDL